MYLGKTIGIGLATHERPDYLSTALQSILNTVAEYVDYLFVCDDNSIVYADQVRETLHNFAPPFKYEYLIHDRNMSVCITKNDCLEALMREECDYIFIMENDMQILHSNAITKYIDASIKYSIHHLNYAHHGPINTGPPLGASDLIESEMVDDIDVYTACIGCWSFYTKECIANVGLMDEALCYNSMEHVEHTLRCAKEGFTFRFWRFADVSGSKEWITPQPDAIESSTIRNHNADWHRNMNWSLEYVKNKHPEHW
jgi:GT2 family glycosyltransferase